MPENKGYTKELIPQLDINYEERIAVMRKGGSMRIQDYIRHYQKPTWLTFGVGWDVSENAVETIDLDASAV